MKVKTNPSHKINSIDLKQPLLRTSIFALVQLSFQTNTETTPIEVPNNKAENSDQIPNLEVT